MYLVTTPTEKVAFSNLKVLSVKLGLPYNKLQYRFRIDDVYQYDENISIERLKVLK